MTIVDAIEKAKRLARERSAGEAAPATARRRSAARPAPMPLPAADHSSSPTTIPVEVREQAAPRQFAFAPYDAAVCSRNRVIVPEIDARLLQTASSPYRMIRTRILHRSRASNWSVLGVTSAGPSEGKSLTALNLAISIAREGNSDVFLLDVDMRNPSLCRYLGCTPPRELTEYFLGQVEAQDVLFSTGLPNLTLAGSNVPVANASELLASDRLEGIIDFIRQSSSNPLILLDLPPAVNTDDALVVAPRLDATVLVVSEGVTRRDELETALRLLADFPIAGVVLNKSLESIGSDYYGAQ